MALRCKALRGSHARCLLCKRGVVDANREAHDGPPARREIGMTDHSSEALPQFLDAVATRYFRSRNGRGQISRATTRTPKITHMETV
jgi:hypothetical protein